MERDMQSNIFIAYASPSGTTRHVAQVIETALGDHCGYILILDIARTTAHDSFKTRLAEAGPDDCLFVGSPVYRDMAVPPMMAFIEALADANGCRAVPFVTWGGAFSGIALWQMGKTMVQSGFRLAGGVKVLARHAMMCDDPHPVGKGHPDAEDDAMVGGFAREISTRLAGRRLAELDLEQLDYHLPQRTVEVKNKLDQPWLIIPKKVDEGKCTQCGTCQEVCPVGAVELDDWPIFDKRCFDCFNCIRLCPEEAFIPAIPIEKIRVMIVERVERFIEQPLTQVFMAWGQTACQL